MIYNFCITCEHYNDRNRFPEACYGCYNGRNYEVNHYYDMTKEDIEKMIKSEEEEDMKKDLNCEPFKIDFVESDIIDELLVLTKKNNEMLIDIQKRLDESEGLILPKHLSEEDDVFDEKRTVESIVLDQEREDKYVKSLRSNSFYGMYADYPAPPHSRDEIKEACDKINTACDSGEQRALYKKETGTTGYRCADCVYAKTPFDEEPCNSCNGYSNYKLHYVHYECDKCRHASKMLYDEPCYSCSIPNDNYKFEPMSSIDKMKKTITDAFANCAKAVKEFDKRFNETEREK